jgi:predicted site-specific integrase-resolvase
MTKRAELGPAATAVEPEFANDQTSVSLITRAEAAKRLRVSYATVARREANGEFEGVKKNGSIFYDEAEIDACCEASQEAPAVQMLRVFSDNNRALMETNVHYAQAIPSIVETSGKVMTQAMGQLVALFTESATSLREQNKELELRCETMRMQIEASRADTHEHEMEKSRDERSGVMQLEVLELAKRVGPSVIAKLTGQAPPPPPPPIAAMLDELGVTREHLIAIAQAGILPIETLQKIDHAMRASSPAAAPIANGAAS